MTVDLAFAFDTARQAGLSAAAELLVRSALIRSMTGIPIGFPDGLDLYGDGKTFPIPASLAGQDITSWWEDNWGAANETGGTILVPPGEFIIPASVAGQAGSYKVPAIVGARYDGHPTAASTFGSALKLKDGADADMFQVAASDASDIGPGPLTIMGVTLDGNRTAQSGSNHVINYLSHTATSNKQRSGFLHNVYIKNAQTSGIRVGVLRNAGIISNSFILFCGTAGAGSAMQFGSCNDWELYGLKAGVTEGAVIQDSGAGSLYAFGCAFFIGGTHGYKGDTAALDHIFEACSFDTNDEHGAMVDTAGDYPWAFNGCRWQQNSFAANDVSSHLKIGAGNTLVSVTGGNFFPGSTNNAKYVYDITAGGKVTHVGGALKTGAYVTAFSNDMPAVYGVLPGERQAITGSRGGNAALANLLTGLVAAGLITDGTS
jgi:hypothetical protein